VGAWSMGSRKKGGVERIRSGALGSWRAGGLDAYFPRPDAVGAKVKP